MIDSPDAPASASVDPIRDNNRVTLRDVAERVGVSVSTVSRALSGAPGISASVRGKIREVAEELGHAGALKTASIVVVIDVHSLEAGTGEFMQSVQRGIKREAHHAGLNLSFQNVVLDGANPTPLNPEADGYLLFSLQDERYVERLSQSGIPAVIVNGREPLMRLDSIAPANRTGGYLGTRHLVELGHREILFLGHSLRPTIRDRMRGSLKALEEAGIAHDPALWLDLADMRADVGYKAVRDWLDDGGPGDVTAIQCANDASALGAMAALAGHGLRVAQDVSVIGFDDIPAAGLNATPLSTVHVDTEDLGARSVRRLAERIQSPQDRVTYTETAVEVVRRASTAPPRA